MAAMVVAAASEGTAETRSQHVGQAPPPPNDTAVDLEEWEAVVGRCDAAYGRLLNRPIADVMTNKVEALLVLEALDSTTGTYATPAGELARAVRGRYGAALDDGPAVTVDDATTDGGGGPDSGGEEAVEPTAAAAAADGSGEEGSEEEGSEEEGSGEEGGEASEGGEEGTALLRHERIPCGDGGHHLYVLWLKATPEGARSDRARKYGTSDAPVRAGACVCATS
jgi:hypothetical protein